MIEPNTYEQMKQFSKAGGSWAIWEMPQDGEGPKARVGDLSVFERPDILEQLNGDYVFVGLNQSKQESCVASALWRNFHSIDNKRQQDYKLRYALYGTKYWGAYMTDAIKNLVETDSSKVQLTKVEGQIQSLRKELNALGGNPVLVGMGGKAFNFLNRYLGKDYSVVGIKHYACYVNKDKYRVEVLNNLSRN